MGSISFHKLIEIKHKMDSNKFLGVCIVAAACIVAGALCYHAAKTSPRDAEETGIGRYQFQPSNPPGVIWTIDTVTGEVKSKSG